MCNSPSNLQLKCLCENGEGQSGPLLDNPFYGRGAAHMRADARQLRDGLREIAECPEPSLDHGERNVRARRAGLDRDVHAAIAVCLVEQGDGDASERGVREGRPVGRQGARRERGAWPSEVERDEKHDLLPR